MRGASLAAAQSYATERGLGLVLDIVDDGRAAVALYEQLVGRRPADGSAPDGHRPLVRIYASPA